MMARLTLLTKAIGAAAAEIIVVVAEVLLGLDFSDEDNSGYIALL
jgi:hypothetical protein